MTFNSGVFLKNIFVGIKADDVPELEAVYTLSILSVDGGADLSSSASNVTFKIRLVGIVSSFFIFETLLLFLSGSLALCYSNVWHFDSVKYSVLVIIAILGQTMILMEFSSFNQVRKRFKSPETVGSCSFL